MAEDIIKGLQEAVISGNAAKVEELVNRAIEEKLGVEQVLNDGLIAGMMVIGKRFKNNEVYVPEVLISARAMSKGTEMLEPLIADSGIKPIAKVAIGTVKGDLHDIGKNLVVMMWKGAGFQVEDLGIDVPPEKFIEAAKNGAQVIGLSALLTTTMVAMKEVVEELQAKGLADDTKIIVGGAPVTQDFADEIGAHAYSPDAASAVDKVKELLGI